MKDPIPLIPWLSRLTEPLAHFLSLPTLPLHIHEVMLSFLAYTIIHRIVAPRVSTYLFPIKYTRLSPDKKLNWDVHVVSLCQSTMINTLALWVMWNDHERSDMDWRERVWGYTGAAGMIQGMATGYFLWDLCITGMHVGVFGWGMLAHALSALTVFSFGFRPFINYYGCTFILYELSSPFLNFHWFFDKLDMTGSKPQLYNGIILLVTFFSCRLVWGTYNSVRVYQDMWRALHHPSLAVSGINAAYNATINYGLLNSTTGAMLGQEAVPLYPSAWQDVTYHPNGTETNIMHFAGDEHVPFWLAMTYLGSNITLNTLNFFWFGKMVEAVRKRFTGDKTEVKWRGTKAEGNGKVTEGDRVVIKETSMNGNGSVKIAADETEVRKRRIKA